MTWTDLSLLAVYFQSVHEPTGPSEGYLQLEELVKQVVSPFLGISEDRGPLRAPRTHWVRGSPSCQEPQ